MAPKQPCAKYQYVVTPSGPKIVPVPVPEAQNKDEEPPTGYNSGGYLQVQLNDSFKDGRYIVLRKLGWGHFSTVWLVKDANEDRHSALKVVKSAGRYAETARDEIKLLRQVMEANPSHRGRDHVVSFLDAFQHCGPQDTHVCIVFEPLGETLLALIERHKKSGVPMGIVKVIAKQMLLGLQYLHDECDLVHTDIKPENVLISIPNVEELIQAELSLSPSPISRTVGVPPTKSRTGVTIPQRPNRSARHVQIFDSQPLPSPSSASTSTSTSPATRSGLRMSRIKSNGTSSSPPPASPASSSSGLTPSTPPTSLGSDTSKIRTSISRIQDTGVASVHPVAEEVSISELEDAVSSSVLAAREPGPSLLSQTAPSVSVVGSMDEQSLSDSSSDVPSPVSSIAPPPISIKIADLGNATPSRKHYTEDIQTRQYRCPEAIVGRADWSYQVDIWSAACVIFELLTAEFLFDPQGQGELFTKDDDHMAQIIELLGDFPVEAKMGGRYSRELFDHKGSLRYIRSLKPWPLKRVMMEKYLFSEDTAQSFCDFMLPMLIPDQRFRKQARDMIDNPWLEIDADLAGDLIW